MEKNGVVLIGGSAGSIDGIIELIPKIPVDFPFSIVIVIHRKANSESQFEQVLSRKSQLKVHEVYDKMLMEPGQIYLAPGDYHLLVDKDNTLCLDGSEKVNYSRPSIDVSFSSFARVFGSNCIGILLSGANADGADGLRIIKECGGLAVVQSPDSAAVATMPMAAISLACPDYIADVRGISQFLMQIAFDNREAGEDGLVSIGSFNPDRPNVLIVDDLDDNLFTLGALLKSEPYAVHKANSGRKAIEMALMHSYDCIVLDVQMPDLDGFEVARLLSEHDQTANVPIIFLSALGSDKEKVMHGLKAGAVDFIGKPPDPELLKAKLNLCIKMSAKHKETKKVFDSVKREHQVMKDFATDVNASLRYAQNIQSAILPPAKLFLDKFSSSFVFFKPKESIGGDFYFLRELDGKIVLGCGDCTGHGVPGAMMTMICANIIHHVLDQKNISRPDQILSEFTREFKASLRNEFSGAQINDGLELAVCTINADRSKLAYSGAGRPLIKALNKQVQLFSPGNMGISGASPDEVSFDLEEFSIEAGCRFYLFTDGVVDQFGGPSGKKFMSQRLLQLLTACSAMQLDLQKEYIQNEIEQWKGQEEQIDDMLMIGIGF